MDENILLPDIEPVPEEILSLSGEISDAMDIMLDSYITDEGYEDNLRNILEEDDYLTEELVDKLSVLNILEGAAEGEVSRSDIEQAYLSVIDSFFELSKMISPMNGFGRDRIEAGLSLIREFEKEHWLISTQIVPENAEVFSELIPVSHYEDILAGRKRAVGALRHIGEEVYAAGAVVYRVHDDLVDAPFVSLDWIMVHEDLRMQGIGNFLMAHVVEAVLLLNKEDASVYIELPVRQTEDEEELRKMNTLENFLDSWKFAFSMGYGSGFSIALSDVIESEGKIKHNSLNIQSLGNIGQRAKTLLQSFFERRGQDYDADIVKVSFDFFDPDISSAVISDGEIRSVLLFHRFADGDYRYEAFRAMDEENDSDLPALVAFSCEAAAARDDGNPMISGSFASEEGYEQAGKLLPNIKVPMVYRGVMYPPEEIITSEEWGKLRGKAGFSNDVLPEDDSEE